MSISQSDSLNNFISVHYNIVWQSQGSSARDWRIFLLTELHTDPLMGQINGLFISKFATAGSFLLLEGEKAGECVSDPAILSKLCVSTTQIPLRNVLGWDTVDDLETPLYAASYTYLEQISTFLIGSIGSINFQETLPKLYEHHDPATAERRQELVAQLGEELNQFAKGLAAEKQLIPYKQQRVLNKAVDLQQRMFAAINREWPRRTASMITTLEKTSLLIQESHGKIFLIAGEDHLKESSNPAVCASRPLKPFYDFLQGRADIVILESKTRCSPKELLVRRNAGIWPGVMQM